MTIAAFRILGDNPAGGDEPAGTDLLNFAAFVEPFADRLLGSVSNTPFTVGIFADWGQGKTTVMRMLQASLRRHDCPTVWFDPWKYNSREAVWKGLALTLIEEVRAHDSLRRELKRKQNSLTEFGLKALVGWLVGRDWAADVVQAVKTEPWSPALLHELEADLRLLFESVSPERVANPRPLVLFVDDLDRCLPQAALAVLEALKLVLSRPGLITIMGIAEHELSCAVFAAYAKELESLGTDFDRDWGRRYIQKIIQMPFPLPIVTEASMDEYVGQCLADSGVGSVLGGDKRWCRIIREACQANLREIKRFINNFISEKDKADANAAARRSAEMAPEPARVAFVLLLAWRFREFLGHARSRANDPELLLRYQLFFLQRAQRPDVDPKMLLDDGKKYHEDPALATLFTNLFAAPKDGRPLVAPFAAWTDLEPYLQFGIRAPIEAPETPSSLKIDSEEAPVRADRRLEMRPEVEEFVSKARAVQAAGHLDEATALLNSGREIARKAGDRFGEGVIVGKLGQILESRHQWQDAFETYKESLTIAESVQDVQGAWLARLGLANVLLGLREPKRALEQALQARALAAQVGDSLGELTSVQTVAAAQEAASDLAAARTSWGEALTVAEKLRHTPGTLVAQNGLAALELKAGDVEAALKAGQTASALADQLGDRGASIQVKLLLAHIYAARREWETAFSQFHEAIRIAGTLGDRRQEASLWAALGDFVSKTTGAPEGITAWETARAIFVELNDKGMVRELEKRLKSQKEKQDQQRA